MTTKRLPFQASTLCAGGTLLVLGGFLALNLAGCGGGNSGGILTPTPLPGTTATPMPSTLVLQLQTPNGTSATGGTVTLSNSSGLSYSGNANKSGLVTISRVVPGLYTLVFSVKQLNGTTVSTTRSLTVTSAVGGTQTIALRQGDTGTSNPFTITGRVLLNPLSGDGTTSPVAQCAADIKPVTDALIITVRDLNSTNGSPIIAQVTRPAQPSSTTGPQRGLYSISIPYRPRSFQVTVINANDAPFAGISASSSFPQTSLTVTNIDVCTNQSNIAPQPAVTATPSPTPFATATTVGPPVATPTPTPVVNPVPTNTPAPTSTPQPTNTPVPTNTPIPGTGPVVVVTGN